MINSFTWCRNCPTQRRKALPNCSILYWLPLVFVFALFISQVPLTQILYLLWVFAWLIICQNWNLRSRDEWQGTLISTELSSKICPFIISPVPLRFFPRYNRDFFNAIVQLKLNYEISFLISDSTPLASPRVITCWCGDFSEMTRVSPAYILMLSLFRL